MEARIPQRREKKFLEETE